MFKEVFYKYFGQLYTSIYSFYLEVFAIRRKSTYWINRYTDNSEINVVQIGSNDGIMDDHLYHLIKKNNNWRVLFVEPVTYLFEKLKSNYGIDKRYTFKNVAIDDGFKKEFYTIKKDAHKQNSKLPYWCYGLGSYDKENILRHLNGILEPYIVKIEVEPISLMDLLSENKIEKLYMLQIDTEGHDWKILRQLNLNKYNPVIILFEYVHLLQSEKKEAIFFLKNDYFIFKFGFDLLCIKRDKIRSNDWYFLKNRLVNESHNRLNLNKLEISRNLYKKKIVNV